MSYLQALALQERLLAARPAWNHDLLILLEHDPVVTAGRSTQHQHLLVSPEQLAEHGIDYHEACRGGDLTYHSPGQLVGYPLFDLTLCNRDLHLYLRKLETVIIETLAEFGLVGRLSAGRTGVWVGDQKIASIGIAVRRWISWHGFALNVANDLQGFATIVPCGLQDTRMTSMSACLQREVDLTQVTECIIEKFNGVFALPYLGDYAES